MIKCIRCQTLFEQRNPYHRVCPKKHESVYHNKNKGNDEFWKCFRPMRIYFQDPIYQLYKLFNDEHAQPNKYARKNFSEQELEVLFK